MFIHATEAWLNSIKHVYENGNTQFPRNIETKEILNDVCSFDMNAPICHHNLRKLSYKFMAAEAYWITSGSPLVEDIAPYNKHISDYTDDGYIFNGAYGPAFLSQVNFVVNTLFKDQMSRQAVMTIWHPNPIASKDHKCTVSLMFNIRDGRINTTVQMRSNDLILGRPYDMFNFTIMTLRILTLLNSRNNILLDGTKNDILLGTLTLNSMSAHIYARDFEIVERLNHSKYDYENTHFVPSESTMNWQLVVDSLLACRDMTDTTNLWKIRP